MRKAAGYEDPLPSKEPLLLVNGLRSFHARPVYSTDEHGADKHKMERFLHEGRWAWLVGVQAFRVLVVVFAFKLVLYGVGFVLGRCECTAVCAT